MSLDLPEVILKGINGISFGDLREKITPKSVVIKKYTIEGKEVVIAKEETTYSITVDGEKLYDEFEDQVEAEEAATAFLELLTGEEEVT